MNNIFGKNNLDGSANSPKMRFNLLTLAFKDNLENEFQKDYYKSSIKLLRISFILGIFYYSAFAILDGITLPEIRTKLAIIRFLYVCPIILIIFFLSFTKNFYKWWQIGALIATVVSGGGIVMMTVENAELARTAYYPGIMLVLIYCYMLIKLRFVWATLAGWIIIALYILSLIMYPGVHNKIITINLFFLISANILGMFGGYALEFYTRRDFFFRYLLEKESEKVEKANVELEVKVIEKTKELQRDIRRRKRMEEKLKISVKEKEILLRELYHRTKNNLQVITSMIRLRTMHLKNRKVTNIFKEIESKILGMALVHENLYESGDLSHLNLKDYIEKLAHIIIQNLATQKEIEVAIKGDNIKVLLDTAMPIGIIINEIMTNSLKYAFPEDGAGCIDIHLNKNSKDEIELDISDNGVGLPDEFDLEKDKGIGLRTVCDLVDYQLQGKYMINNKNGVHFRMVIKEELYEPRI